MRLKYLLPAVVIVPVAFTLANPYPHDAGSVYAPVENATATSEGDGSIYHEAADDNKNEATEDATKQYTGSEFEVDNSTEIDGVPFDAILANVTWVLTHNGTYNVTTPEGECQQCADAPTRWKTFTVAALTPVLGWLPGVYWLKYNHEKYKIPHATVLRPDPDGVANSTHEPGAGPFLGKDTKAYSCPKGNKPEVYCALKKHGVQANTCTDLLDSLRQEKDSSVKQDDSHICHKSNGAQCCVRWEGEIGNMTKGDLFSWTEPIHDVCLHKGLTGGHSRWNITAGGCVRVCLTAHKKRCHAVY